jgi:flagellar basal body-associated protein FliL
LLFIRAWIILKPFLISGVGLDEDILEEVEDTENKTAEEPQNSGDEPDNKSIPENPQTRKKGFIKKILGSRKAVIIAGAVLVLIICIVIAAFMFFSKGQDTQAEQKTSDQKNAVQNQDKTLETRNLKPVFKDIVDLAPFERISLKSGSLMPHLTMTLSLELTDERYRRQIVAMEDKIRNIVETQAKKMVWLELRSSEGKLLFKYDLIGQINALFPKPVVRNVYFTSFIMQ